MKMKRCCPILLLCGLLAGCAHTITTGEIEGVIFPANKANFAALATGRKGLQYWAPSESDIAKAIPKIKTFLATQAPSIASRITKYRCQYFGIIVDGKKRVYCNFFHRDGNESDWKTDGVLVYDGGDWYFQIEYEIETKRCLNFQVNGEA